MDRQFLQEVAFPESTKQVSLAITENVNQDDLAVCAIQQYILFEDGSKCILRQCQYNNFSLDDMRPFLYRNFCHWRTRADYPINIGKMKV